MWLVLRKKGNAGVVCVNTAQVVGMVEENRDGKHVATELFTTNTYVHFRVEETIDEITRRLRV